MSTEVRVNGNTFNLFTQWDVSDSLDDFSRGCRFTTTEPVNGDSFVKIGDLVEVYADTVKIVTGYVEKISEAETNNSHTVSYNLRSKTADIIDSSVPDNVKSIRNVSTFRNLCNQVISGLGLDIQVVDNVGARFNDKLKAGEIGQSAADFLQEYARKVQVFLNSDGDGNILLRQPAGTLQTILLEGRPNANIIEAKVDLDYSKRYNKYIVRSTGTLAGRRRNAPLTAVGRAFDNEIRSTRTFEKIAESPMSSAECQKAAAEEANIRRTRSFRYTAKIAGYSANGELWEVGKFVKVVDETRGVQGTYVIKDIQYAYSEAGEFTTMVLTYSDAYTATDNPTELTTRTSTNAEPYTVVYGDTLSQIAARNNTTVDEIASINPAIVDVDKIQAGQVIQIPVTGGNN